VLGASKLDTSALMKDAASLEGACSTTGTGMITEGVRDGHGVIVATHGSSSAGSAAGAGGSGGVGGGVSTPPETPSVSPPLLHLSTHQRWDM